MTDRSIRVSDAERESVAGLLRDAYVAGRLDHTEFEERSLAAYSAKTWRQLTELTADLPARLPSIPGLPTDGAPWIGGRGRPRSTFSARRRVVLFVGLLSVLGLLVAAPSVPAAAVMSGVLALCLLAGVVRR